MKLIRQLFSALRHQRQPQPARYGPEVLLAGWVQLPHAFHKLTKSR